MKIAANDQVMEVDIVRDDDIYVFTVTANWMWKLSKIDEYREQWRGWSWVKVWAITDKTWDIVWASLLTEEAKKEGEVLLISKSWQTIRIPLGSIRVTWRVSQWVILTKIKAKDDMLVSATVMKKSEWDEDGATSWIQEEWESAETQVTMEIEE